MATKRRQVSFLLVMLAGIAVMASFGVWQLQRLEWKEGLIAKVAAADRLPPLTELPSAAEIETQRFRFMELAGAYLEGPRFLLAGRYRNGVVGYHVLAPFAASPSGRVILVNRGWIPAEQHAAYATGARESATLHGRLMTPPAPPKIGKLENDAARNLWFYADVPRMTALLGKPIEPMMVELAAPANAAVKDAYPIPSTGKMHWRNDHLGYAITWFAIALAGCAVLGVQWRRWRAMA